MKFSEIIKNENVVVRCFRFEHIKTLFSAALQAKLTWASIDLNDSPIENILEPFGEETCINLHNGEFGNTTIYKHKTIIEFEDVEFEDYTYKAYTKESLRKMSLSELIEEMSFAIDQVKQINEELTKRNKGNL